MRNSTFVPTKLIESRPLPYQLLRSPRNGSPRNGSPPAKLQTHVMTTYPYRSPEVTPAPVIIQKELQFVEDTSKIDSLQTHMKILIDQNHFFQNQLDIARNKPPIIQEQIHYIEDRQKIDQLNHQFVNLLEDMKNISTKNLNKEEENILLKKQVNQLSSLHSQADFENRQLNSRIRDISNLLESVRSSNKILAEYNQSSSVQINSLQFEVQQYLDEIRRKNQVLDFSNKKISSMEDQLHEMKNLKLNLSIMESSNQVKSNKLSELENIKRLLTLEGVEKEKQINELAYQIDNQKSTIIQQQYSIDGLQNTLNKNEDFIQNQASIIKQQIIERDQYIEEHTIKIINLEKKVRQLRDVELELENTQMIIKQKNIKISELDNLVSSVLKDGQQKDNEIQLQCNKMDELHETIKSLQQSIKHQELDIEKQENYISTQSNIISKLKLENQDLRNECDEKMIEIDIKIKQLNNNNEEMENLEKIVKEDTHQQMVMELNSKQKELNEIIRKVEELNATIITNQQDIVLLKENLNKSEQYIINQSNTISSQIKEKNQMQEELTQKISSLEMTQNELNDLKVQLQILEKSIISKNNKISEIESNKIKLIYDGSSKENHIQQLTCQVDDQSKVINTLQHTIQNLQESISHSEQLIYNQSKVIKEQIEEIQQLSLNNESYANALVDQENHIKGLNYEIEKYILQRQEMQIELEQIESKEERLAKLHRELEEQRHHSLMKVKENDVLLSQISKLELQHKKAYLMNTSLNDNPYIRRINIEDTAKKQRFQHTDYSPGRYITPQSSKLLEKSDQLIKNSSNLSYNQMKNSSSTTYLSSQYVK